MSLFLMVGTMWADFTQSYDTSAALWSDWSAALPDGLQAVVTEHGNDGTVKYGVNEVVVSAEGDIKVKFQYGGGQPHKIVILGVELLSGENVVKSDYHVGESGGNNKNNTYTLSGATAGEYTIRYFVCNKPGDHALNSTAGTITFSGNITEKTFEVEPISTEYCYQLKNAAYSTILASDGSYVTVSPKADASDYSQYWAFEEGTDGTYTLRNLAKNKYLVHNSKGNTAWTVGDKGTEFTVGVQSPATVNQSARYYVSYDLSNTYACMHDANWGSGYSYRQLVGWEAGAAASQWILTKTDVLVKTQPLSVVYSFTYGGVEKYKQTEVALVGDNYPGLSIALPFGVSAEMPTGIIAAEDVMEGVVNKEIVLSVNLPFKYADSYEVAEKDWNWYYLQFHANSKNYLYYDASKTYLDASKTTIDEENEDAYTWAFVGNPFDGFKVVNRLAGKEMQLNASADGAVLGSAGHVFVLTSSSFAENGFFMASVNGDKKDRFNKQNDKVVYWSGADAGSTFMIERRPTDAERLAVAVEKAQALLDANANNHAVAPALRQYSTAGYEAFAAAIQDKNATSKSVETAILEFEKSKNLPLFTIDSQKDYALGQSIYENEEGALKFKATDAIDKTMLWAFDMAATEVGVTDKVVVRNAATGKLFWGASFISVIETEPAVEDDGVFMFKTEGTGNPIHAQANGSSIVRWSSADANAVGGASTWKFAFVGVSNPAAYDLSEVAEQFKAQAAAFGALQENAALSALPAVQEKWAEAMGVVEPLYTQVSGNELVLKADVVAAMATMKEIQAVVTYYSETFVAAKDEANAAMDELDEESEEYKALLGAINVSAVTTVTELEAKAEIIAEVLEYLASLPEADPNDYTSYIINAAVTSAEGWNIGAGKHEGGLMKYGSGKLVDFNQTITLPAGQYKMTAKAAYRYTSGEQSEYEAIQAGTNTHLAKLYAETATYKYEGNVMNRYEGASDTDYAAGSGSVTVNGKFVPNSSSAVLKWFEAGQYVNEIVFNVQADGEVKIGIETKETVPGGEYTNISAWTLTRLGDAEADPKPVEVVFKPGQDATFMIENAQVTSASGWVNGSANKDQQYTGAPDNTYLDWCNWSGKVETMDMHQVVPNMPAGYYTLKVATRAHNKMNGVVYAITDVDTYSTEIHHVDNVGNELGGGWGWTVVEGFAMAARGNMTIGFKVTAPEDGVWAGADNFMLTYLGATELEVAQYEFLTVKDQFDLMSTGIYQVMYVGRMGAAYEALSEKVWALASKEDATAEEYKACVAEMKAVMADIEAAEDYYVNVFSPLANECFEVQDNSVAKSEEAAEAFAEACDKMGWSGTMGVATVADLEAIVAEVQPALNAYVLNAIPINGVAFNYSFFLTNPSFETGNIDGWTVGSSADTGVRENAGGYATANGDGDYLFNTWWQGVMLSQEAEGLPNGNYRLTASLASGDGGKAATIFLVANGEKKGFTMDHKGEFEDCSIEFKVTDGKVSIATIGGNDDASYNENGHWWYKSDNYRIHYLGDGGVTGVSLWTKETYYDEWAKEDVQYDLEWDMPELTEIGATFKFEVSVEAPEDADTTIVWSVSNDKVLSIDQTGLLTVIGSGSGFYEVMATAPNGISATCKVKVEAFQEGDITEMEIVYEGGWWIESTMAGETFQLGVEYNEDATNVDLVWSSTNEKVATVDQNGLVTIVGSGEADIVVTASSGVQASISVVAEISEEDGIDNKSVEADAVIYDIHGRRVEKMTKGLYIVNGRKVMVK